MSLPRLRAHLRVIGLSFEMALRHNLTDAFIIFGLVIQPLIIALLAFWMLRDRGSDDVIFIVVGTGMTGLWTAVLFISSKNISSERYTGTLELLVGVPAPIQTVIFGKNLANVVQSLISMVVCYALAGVVYGNLPHIAQPGWFFLALIPAVLAYVSTGLLLAGLFVLNADVGRFENGLEFPVYILAGFLFPVALLPGWTTPFSYILAPYWVARGLHGASSGAPLGDFLFACGMMVLFSILYLAISRYFFRRILYKARVDASLGRM